MKNKFIINKLEILKIYTDSAVFKNRYKSHDSS